MIRQTLCTITGHSINRKKVWHDGLDFRTKCSRCQVQLVRGIDGWRTFDEQRDGDQRRTPHSRSA